MNAKQFCLKWNNFQSNILNAFESLQSTEDLTDVTLTCEGLSVKAHKFILSACSPYFRTVFKENPCPHPVIILKDVTYIDLIAIINFMYHGEVLVAEAHLASFLQTAKLLQVSGLNNTNEGSNKKISSPKRSKPIRTESPDYFQKKSKLCSTSKVSTKTVLPNDNNNPVVLKESQEECEKIFGEDSDDEQFADVNENVEVIVNEKSECSILEAALDPKPGSILERSLRSSSAGKSPSTVQFGSDSSDPTTKSSVIPLNKPSENELERRVRSTSSRSSSPTANEFLQQSIKIEEEPYDDSSLDLQRDSNFQIVRVDNTQPHHSSQCGNCPHCGKVYSNQSALKYHVRLVHSDLTNMYCCHLCPEAFDYRDGYKKHMAEAHCIRN